MGGLADIPDLDRDEGRKGVYSVRSPIKGGGAEWRNGMGKRMSEIKIDADLSALSVLI